MHETTAELQELQDLIDRSFASAGEHLASIMSPGRRLSAADTVAYLQGVKHLSVATVTSAGEPRVGPVDGLFLHGHWWFSTSSDAVRVRHLEARPAISAAHVVGDDVAVIAHGLAHLVRGGTEESGALLPLWAGVYDGTTPEDWVARPEDARFVRIDAARMFTYCFDRARLAALMPPG